MFLVGRFLNGVSVGMINCTVPTYISEIAPAAQRGLIVGAHGIVTCYGFGVDASSYTYCSEIFPTNTRAQGVGFSVSGLLLMNTIYTTAAGPAFNSIGWRLYLFFIIVPTFMLPIVYFYYPETRGLSLEEVGAAFGDEVAMDISHLSEKYRAELDERLETTVDITHFNETEGLLVEVIICILGSTSIRLRRELECGGIE